MSDRLNLQSGYKNRQLPPPRPVNRYGVLHLAERGFSRPAQQLIAAIRSHLAQIMADSYLEEA